MVEWLEVLEYDAEGWACAQDNSEQLTQTSNTGRFYPYLLYKIFM